MTSTCHPSSLGTAIFAIELQQASTLQPPYHRPYQHPSSLTPNCPSTPTMGFTDFFTDVWETFAHPSPDAEAPQGGSSTKSPVSGTGEESGEEAEVNKQDANKGGESKEQAHKPSGKGSDEDEGEDEEEEEEETVDPKEQLEKECVESKECHPAKHHYDECVERVTGQIDNDGKASEDCVEEFFHLAHCATQCAAPRLFAQLK
ncbi:ubiquinol-cytochrome C reductase hinge protein-domain-containing protein [Phaeosphaeriaceae sp. PMI808]|nr:ubiquinol-cytochrome C reductase hinge protein-domain-containing protein [Phaeosphaeriaceae sp. PMI808]